MLEYDVATGHGVYTEMERLTTIASKDLLELQPICTKRYNFDDMPQLTDLTSVNQQIMTSKIQGCTASNCRAVMHEASNTNSL